MKDGNDDILILDCPCCQGPAVVEYENGWCCYITCMDCGCHTVEARYNTKDEKKEAVKKCATLWNLGKVIKMEPGE